MSAELVAKANTFVYNTVIKNEKRFEIDSVNQK